MPLSRADSTVFDAVLAVEFLSRYCRLMNNYSTIIPTCHSLYRFNSSSGSISGALRSIRFHESGARYHAPNRCAWSFLSGPCASSSRSVSSSTAANPALCRSSGGIEFSSTTWTGPVVCLAFWSGGVQECTVWTSSSLQFNTVSSRNMPVPNLWISRCEQGLDCFLLF